MPLSKDLRQTGSAAGIIIFGCESLKTPSEPAPTSPTPSDPALETGTIVISVSTTGVEVGTDGYDTSVTAGGGLLKYISVPSNGTKTIDSVVPGTYAAAVTGIAPNCSLAKLATVVVSAAKRADVSVPVKMLRRNRNGRDRMHGLCGGRQ